MHVKTPKALRILEGRSKEMMFSGYERDTKGYRCFNPTPHKIHFIHDIISEEGCK